MIGNIVGAFLFSLACAALFVVAYLGPFGTMLSDDIEIVSGKKAARRRWKISKGNFIQKLFYVRFIDKIKKWHYFLLICFMISFPIAVISFDILIIFGNNIIIRYILIVSGGICLLSTIIDSFDRHNLYWYSVRRRPRKQGKR